MNSTFFILSSLLIVLTCSSAIETKLGLTKRNRFLDPNSKFRPTSQRINNLIMILGNRQNKVKEESIHKEIIDIIDSISWQRFGMQSAKNYPVTPYNWYMRKG